MTSEGGTIASIRDAAKRATAAPDMRPGGEDGGDRYDAFTLPPGSPVTPLGIQGLKLWLLDASNQLIQLPTDCRKGDLTLIFGGSKYLVAQYPQYPKPSKDNPDPDPTGFNQTKVQEALISACHGKGIFNPQGRVFGRGAHRAVDDPHALVLHMGRRVMIAGAADKKGKRGGALTEHAPGAIDESFFPALPALPPPAATASTPKDATDLLALFGQWYWTEPQAAPILLLGMVAQMFMCGALKWRSHAWLTGPTTSGKTTLQDLIKTIHADWCLHVEDASEAAIRQVLGDDTLPVMIDEAEADDNPDKQRAIMNLAKKASSGAKIIRGGADHKGTEFTAQSCFLFSSVLHSLVKGEEINRMAILDMRTVPATAEAPLIDLVHWKTVGRGMHRRMIEQWPRFEDTLSDYKREIASHGLQGRWRDTFGTLLACADCLLHDVAPRHESELNDEHGRERRWVAATLPLMFRGRSEARSDVDRCIQTLMSRLLPGAHGNAPETVGQWVERAMAPKQASDPLDPDAGGVDAYARKRLKQVGLRLVTLKKTGGIDGEPIPNDWANGYLAVAYPTCTPLVDLFRGTEWGGAGGTYLQSLGKVEDVVKGLKVRFAGPNADNAIAVPLMALKGEE